MLGRLDPLYVPHAVDTEVYRPYDRREVRRTLGAPENGFLVGMVAANKGRPSRKGFVQALQAFKVLAEKHDDAYLYLHTMVNPGIAAGEDLFAIVESLGIPKDRVMVADQYRVLFDPFPADAMAKIYSSLDVLLNPSMGEGFGVPILEAQACGVPVIVTDFSAMTELCGAGWLVGSTPFWTGMNAWQVIPDVGDIAGALEECHGRSGRTREKMAIVARKHALEYSLPTVLKRYMLPALRIAEQRFADQQPVTIAPRQRVAA
jgi:glycosyltransferase involved in cell wall biosynthesis